MTSSLDISLNDAFLSDLSRNQAEGLARVFEFYRSRLERIVQIRLERKVAGRVDPGDILQDAFIKAGPKLAEFLARAQVPVFVWLRGIVIDTICEAHRRHLGAELRAAGKEVSMNLAVTESGTFADALRGDLTSPSQVAMRGEDADLVLQALQQLSENDRRILILRHLEELTNDEAASVLGIKKAAASRRYLRALNHLRVVLDKPQSSE